MDSTLKTQIYLVKTPTDNPFSADVLEKLDKFATAQARLVRSGRILLLF